MLRKQLLYIRYTTMTNTNTHTNHETQNREHLCQWDKSVVCSQIIFTDRFKLATQKLIQSPAPLIILISVTTTGFYSIENHRIVWWIFTLTDSNWCTIAFVSTIQKLTNAHKYRICNWLDPWKEKDSITTGRKITLSKVIKKNVNANKTSFLAPLSNYQSPSEQPKYVQRHVRK